MLKSAEITIKIKIIIYNININVKNQLVTIIEIYFHL